MMTKKSRKNCHNENVSSLLLDSHTTLAVNICKCIAPKIKSLMVLQACFTTSIYFILYGEFIIEEILVFVVGWHYKCVLALLFYFSFVSYYKLLLFILFLVFYLMVSRFCCLFFFFSFPISLQCFSIYILYFSRPCYFRTESDRLTIQNTNVFC